MFDPSKLELNLDDSGNTPDTKEEKAQIETQNEVPSDREETPLIAEAGKQENTQEATPDTSPTLLTPPQPSPKEREKDKEEENDEGKKQGEDIPNNENEQIILPPDEGGTEGGSDTTQNNEITEEKEEENNIIFNINITALEDILTLLIEKEYDFVLLEPQNDAVKISMRKDKIEKEAHFIKYPIYSKILLKAKTLTNLVVDETEEVQEGSGEINLKAKTYKVITKIVPSDLGEKLFIKTKQLEKKVKKQVKKTSMSQILGFLAAIAFISLVVGGAFVGFIVLNAKTVEDVKFFYSLGINLNDINNFITGLITFIFSILLFIETIFLIVYLFKFSLTKKELKQKKIRYGIIASFFLILTLISASLWMIIDRQVKSLPNWQEMAYGDVQIYDNSKLTSEEFDKGGSLIEDTSNLIGPVEIKFDLTFFARKEEQKGSRINKFIWDFGEKDVQVTQNPVIIKEFDTVGNQEVSLTVEQVDLNGNVTETTIENIPDINISYKVEKKETELKSGGKLVEFDATSLRELGRIEWYFLDDLSKPVWEGYTFKVGKPIFDETLIGMYIRRNDKQDETLDKIFVIGENASSNIGGEIVYERNILNDLEFDIYVQDVENDFGEGFIEEYKWIIEGKEISTIGTIENPSESSKITYEFKNYENQEIKVILTNSEGKTKEISGIVEIPQNLKLRNALKIYNNGILIEDIQYEEKLGEYYINEIGTPTSLKFDARLVRAEGHLYTLKEVNWDFDSNGDRDDTRKLAKYDLDTPGNYTITAEYVFVRRKKPDDIITLEETIFVEGVKKDAILDLKVEKESSYAPTIVKFDASRSIIKNEDIAKFVWDYGNGIVYEGDAVIPGHKYNLPGEYDIKVKIVTQSGKEYTIEEKLILKPRPQSVVIESSMKRSFVNAGIDFSSTKSEGQIAAYLWDFGDGSVSTEPNPTHNYREPGTYTVTLKVDFTNNNVGEDSLEIEIREE